MLPENVEVVGCRVQRRDAELVSLLAPVAVVVVAADVRDVFAPAEDPDYAISLLLLGGVSAFVFWLLKRSGILRR